MRLRRLEAARLKAYEGETSFDLLDYLPATMLGLFCIMALAVGIIMAARQDTGIAIVSFVGSVLFMSGAIHMAIYPVPSDCGNP